MENSEEIKQFIDEAKSLRSEGKLKEAKHKYLDIAQIYLQLAKDEKNFVEQLSYENLARALVEIAKSIHLEIEAAKLPEPPQHSPKRKEVQKSKKPLDQQLQYVKKEEPKKIKIFQLFAIRDGGVPIISYPFEEFQASEQTEKKINEILFSGAISAINSLMMEVLQRPIQNITFQDGILLIRAHDEISFVIYATDQSEQLYDKLEAFVKEFLDAKKDVINSKIDGYRDMTHEDEVLNLIEKYFIAT